MGVGLIEVLIIGFGVGLPIGAMILRTAISLANRLVSGKPMPAQSQPSDNLQTDSPQAGSPFTDGENEHTSESVRRDLSNPFSPPTTVSENVFTSGIIPKPGFGRAYVITLAITIAGMLITVVAGLVLSSTGLAITSFARIASLILAFLVGSGVTMGMIPTTFKRAVLVMFLFYLIAFVALASIGFIVFGATRMF